MTRDIDRRSVLKGIGTAAAVGLAGCSSSQDETTPEGTEQDGRETNDGTNEEENEGQTSGPLEMEEVATGDIDQAAGIDGTLTYTTAGGNQQVVHGDAEFPAFDAIERGQVPFDDYVSVDDSIAYHGIDTNNGTIEEVIMVGDEELYRETVDASADPNEVEPSATLWDALDGEAIWSEATDQRYPSSFMIGEEQIDPDFDGVGDVQVIGDEVAFTGWRREENGIWQTEAVVKGGEVIEDFSDTQLAGFGGLEGIAGTAAYVKDEGNGVFIQYGDQEIGGQYTNRSSGEFAWVGEIDGSLAFVAEVARDKIESDRIREQALWHDGEEIDRYESIDDDGSAIAKTDAGLAYSFSDSDTSGIVIGDTVEEYVEAPSDVASVGGTPAYDAPGDDGQVVVFGDDQTDPQYQIKHVFEVDGDLAYLAQTEDGVPDSDAIYREA